MKRLREQADLYLSKVRDEIFVFEKLVLEKGIAGWIVGFHAQQIIEKSLKALLSLQDIRFRKTHDLRELMDLLADTNNAVPVDLINIEYLTPFGAQARYEEAPYEEPFTREELKDLVHRFVKWVEINAQPKDAPPI